MEPNKNEDLKTMDAPSKLNAFFFKSHSIYCKTHFQKSEDLKKREKKRGGAVAGFSLAHNPLPKVTQSKIDYAYFTRN